MKVLSLENVSKVFYTKTNRTEAVNNLSFSVEKGEFVAIIGPSGCGKTTVLSLISGLLKPTEGKITIDGGKVGYMLQRDELFEWRTISRNVQLGLELAGKKNDGIADKLLKKYGLWDFRERYPHELSGGMRQRVALIRTLVCQPDLLLLDEPFSALDFQTRLAVCDDVYNIIKSENKTALLVTHDISEAISMADKVIVLSARPAQVLYTHYTFLQQYGSPLKRRESTAFSPQFELLYSYLNGGAK